MTQKVRIKSATSNISSGDNDKAFLKGLFERTLTKITAEDLDGITKLPPHAFFEYWALESIEIPNSITEIGKACFVNCDSLTSIIIPGSVSIIRNQAFNGLDNLAAVGIEKGVQEIESYAFQNCPKLQTITYTGTVSDWSNITKASNPFYQLGTTQIQCSDGTVSIYD